MSGRIKTIGASALTGVMLFASAAASAQTEITEIKTVQDAIKAGGGAMVVIIALSILALCFVIFFLLTLRANVLFPRTFVREAEDAAEEGDMEALQAICRDNDSAAAAIIGAAAEEMAGEQRADYMIVRDAIEDEGARQAGILWQRIQYLMDIAIVAPMVGLLGTVLGMMDSFSGLEAGVNIVNKADSLAAGVTKAMITTAGGLIVGIAAMILYAIFRGRVNNRTARLESACSRVLRRFMVKQVGKY